MKRSTFKILFYLNTSKARKSGLCPVMGRITVDGSIAQFSLKMIIHPDKWNAGCRKATGKSPETIKLNREINRTRKSIESIYERIADTVGYVTAEQIKNELTGVAGKAETLLKLFEEHNLEYEKRVGIDRKKSSFYHYKNCYKHLCGFIRLKYNLLDFPLRKLDNPFIDSFDFYLRVDAGMTAGTILNYIIILKKISKRAVNQGSVLRDPFSEYVPDRGKSKYRHLSGDELERIMTVKIEVPKFRFIRDMFVFSCFTGLAYADICLLSEKHLQKSPDGKVMIKIPRQKTDKESYIKLLEIPIQIIEKYRHERKNDRLFNMPVHCLITYYMRKLEELCNISHLTFHMARHTFATQICLTNGVPLTTISKMIGHSSMRSTQIYAEITSQKVGNDMKKVAGRINEKFNV